MMYTAQLPDHGTFVIRYPRGRGSQVNWQCPMQEIPVGRGRQLKEGRDLAVLSLGPIGTEAANAIVRAEMQAANAGHPVCIAHYDMRFLKPLDTEMLDSIAKNFTQIITVEDGVLNGGFGSAVVEYLSDHNAKVQVHRVGIPDEFVQHGTIPQLRKITHTDADSIAELILNSLKVSQSGS